MTIDNTLNERGARYGDFTDHAAICEALIRICSGSYDITNGGHPVFVPVTQFALLDPVKKQAIRVICDKLARILSPGGDPEYRDNWHNIQGYAKLAEDRCKDGDAKAQAELPLDPVMPGLAQYQYQYKPLDLASITITPSHPDYKSLLAKLQATAKRVQGTCQHGVVVGGYCDECGSIVTRNVPAELDPRDGA